jgi:hypothetical protein
LSSGGRRGLHPPSRVDRKSTGTSSTAQGVPVASLEDIIRDKEIGDRPKDRLALVELRQLSERERELGNAREHDPPDLGPGSKPCPQPCPELRISEANSGHLRPPQIADATAKALHLAVF